MLPADALLAEYAALKAEQNDRIKHRDNLPYVTLLAIATALAGVIQSGAPALLLTIPTLCAILGWTRIATDEKVTAIQRYLRNDLGPRIATAADIPRQQALAWESVVRSDPRRRQRAVLHLGADLLTFVVPAIAAPVTWAATGPVTAVGWVAAAVGMNFAGMLAWQLFTYADLTGPQTER